MGGSLVPVRPYFGRVRSMAVTHSQLELDALAAAGLALADAETLSEALQIVAGGAAGAAHADVAIARSDVDGRAVALGVATVSQALAAELARSGFALDDVPRRDESELARMPTVVQRTARRVGASAVLLLPVHLDGRIGGSLELFRAGEPFDDGEVRLARLAVGQASLAVRAFGGDASAADAARADNMLALAGDALAAGADDSRTAAELARFAVEGTGAIAALLWSGAVGKQ